MPYKCSICGKTHDEFPMDIAFARPDAVLRIPKDQRAERVWEMDDLCVVDRRVRFVRGVAFVPVKGGGKFGWGIWAAVPEDQFNDYLARFNEDLSQESPFRGYAANELGLPEYRDLEGHPLDVQLGCADKRPTFRLLESNHLLSIEQHRGIDMHRVHEIVTRCLPHLFE